MFTRALLLSVSTSALSFAALAAETAPAVAVPAPASTLTTVPAPAASATVTRQELPALVREVLMNEPEIVMDAVKKLKEKQAEEAKQKSMESIAKNKEALLNNPGAPSIGDTKTADVTLVEFFDYHCGYCRHLLPELTKLSKEDPKLRIVFKELPILSDDSTAAARAALAVHRIAKDKYFEFHTALMAHEGKYDEKSLLDIAKKLGINTEKLKAEIPKAEVTAELDKNRQLAEEIGIRGTPALIIGSELYPGAMPYDEMKKAVETARGGKKPEAAVPAPAAAAVKPAIGSGKPDAAPTPPAVPTPAPPAAPKQ
jgi:protein-disulfide isomerase